VMKEWRRQWRRGEAELIKERRSRQAGAGGQTSLRCHVLTSIGCWGKLRHELGPRQGENLPTSREGANNNSRSWITWVLQMCNRRDVVLLLRPFPLRHSPHLRTNCCLLNILCTSSVLPHDSLT
jgi:hypothetical protein